MISRPSSGLVSGEQHVLHSHRLGKNRNNGSSLALAYYDSRLMESDVPQDLHRTCEEVNPSRVGELSPCQLRLSLLFKSSKGGSCKAMRTSHFSPNESSKRRIKPEVSVILSSGLQ